MRHFDMPRLDILKRKFARLDKTERARRLIDLVTISVLLDAGAGRSWKYIDHSGKKWHRSEGLGVATFDMFADGLFSSDPAIPTRVNAIGIEKLTLKDLVRGFQISETNEMVGVEGRFSLIQNLAQTLKDKPEFFGHEVHRPGHILDYVLDHCDENKEVSVNVLWKCIIGFEDIWPRHISGVRRGDVWVHSDLKKIGRPGSDLVPFHKLSQWLALSMLEILEGIGIRFLDKHLFTCLAEYRNGGLLVDTKVINLKNPVYATRPNDPGSELIVEWRALTVVLIDMVADELRKHYGKTKEELPLMKVLEGGTWRAGRVIAAELREDGSSPISIRSDGTVF